VVLKLLNIVQPDVAVFGQKDGQQVIVVKRMVEDLNVPVGVVVAPTVREPDGLAMSSRNVYLTPEERAQAPLLYAGLSALRKRFDGGERSAEKLKQAAAAVFSRAPLLAVEYLEIVDTTTVEPLVKVSGAALAAVACRASQSRTRLIDNVVLGGEL
jgi:pantoate--beta-alanine ligase